MLTFSREVETVFKKIHEGLDLFNYYFSRHEASNNDSQREKLEADLKKEIKKLQKFRDQIKSWQGNDSLEVAITSQKLQEHRRLVEEAMECYKEVEKNSKMKSFSNQSIMLASLDNGGHDLSTEAQECLSFLMETVEKLNEENETLEEEYERVLATKVRKNNMAAIEERKQELETFKQSNEFHIEKIDAIIGYLKTSKVSAASVLAIQDDLSFYLESYQEPDFIDDESLYDDLIKEAKENSENNVVVNGHDESFEASILIGLEEAESTAEADQGEALPKKKEPSSSSSPAPQVEAPVKVVTKQLPPKEDTSSAFITTLKPATAPSKPLGTLKWSAAAAGAGAIQAPAEEVKQSPKLVVSTAPSKVVERAKPEESSASSELLSLLTKNDEHLPYFEVLKNSQLPPAEMEVLSDLNLLRAPVGIQDFVLSFVAANKIDSNAKLLRKGHEQNQLYNFNKPYLPDAFRAESSESLIKTPLFLSKLQSYWNWIRANNQFNRFFSDLEQSEMHNKPEGVSLVNELTMVLFYGYYYGKLPLEHIIAESFLYKLGWVPFGQPTTGQPGSMQQPRTFMHWLKKQGDSNTFKVFDVMSWEIYVRHGFDFDASWSRPQPARSLL